MNSKTINIIKSPTACYYNNCFWTNCGYKGEFAKVILLAKKNTNQNVIKLLSTCKTSFAKDIYFVHTIQNTTYVCADENPYCV